MFGEDPYLRTVLGEVIISGLTFYLQIVRQYTDSINNSTLHSIPDSFERVKKVENKIITVSIEINPKQLLNSLELPTEGKCFTTKFEKEY